jgi:hypothetical protein
MFSGVQLFHNHLLALETLAESDGATCTCSCVFSDFPTGWMALIGSTQVWLIGGSIFLFRGNVVLQMCPLLEAYTATLTERTLMQLH